MRAVLAVEGGGGEGRGAHLLLRGRAESRGERWRGGPDAHGGQGGPSCGHGATAQRGAPRTCGRREGTARAAAVAQPRGAGPGFPPPSRAAAATDPPTPPPLPWNCRRRSAMARAARSGTRARAGPGPASRAQTAMRACGCRGWRNGPHGGVERSAGEACRCTSRVLWSKVTRCRDRQRQRQRQTEAERQAGAARAADAARSRGKGGGPGCWRRSGRGRRCG